MTELAKMHAMHAVAAVMLFCCYERLCLITWMAEPAATAWPNGQNLGQKS